MSTEYSSSLEKTFPGLINVGIKAVLETVTGGAAVFVFVGAEIVVMTGNLLAKLESSMVCSTRQAQRTL